MNGNEGKDIVERIIEKPITERNIIDQVITERNIIDQVITDVAFTEKDIIDGVIRKSISSVVSGLNKVPGKTITTQGLSTNAQDLSTTLSTTAQDLSTTLSTTTPTTTQTTQDLSTTLSTTTQDLSTTLSTTTQGLNNLFSSSINNIVDFLSSSVATTSVQPYTSISGITSMPTLTNATTQLNTIHTSNIMTQITTHNNPLFNTTAIEPFSSTTYSYNATVTDDFVQDFNNNNLLYLLFLVPVFVIGFAFLFLICRIKKAKKPLIGLTSNLSANYADIV